MTNVHRRRIIAAVGSAALASALPARSQEYPSKPIQLVVPNPPGGAADGSARVIAKALELDLKQPVIIDNRPGASGVIATAHVSKAAPDGYTILFGSGSTNVMAPAMLKNVPYDPNRDFTPLAYVGSAAFVVFTSATSKLETIADVIAAARANPGKVSFGTIGAGTVFELAALKLESLADVKFNHIPYKGVGPLQIDVAAGVVDVAVGPINGFVKSDKFKLILTLGPKRSAEVPQVSSAGEAGYPAFDVPVWAGMWAPPGTPRPVVIQLTNAIRKALATKAAQDAIGAAGVQVEFGDDAMLRTLVARQYDEIRALMRKAGIEQQ